MSLPPHVVIKLDHTGRAKDVILDGIKIPYVKSATVHWSLEPIQELTLVILTSSVRTESEDGT